MLIEKIVFTKDYRTFRKGDEIELSNRVTVIVGDNGSGKSSLVGCIRQLFDTPWTPSSLVHTMRDGIPIKVTPEVAPKTPMNYVDLGTDLMKAQTSFMDEHMELQIRTLQLSHGQSAMIQVNEMVQRSKTNFHIIDEPERGLSPSRSFMMAEALNEAIESRPDDQFIVVTHNLPIMKRLAEKVLFLPMKIYVEPDVYWKTMEEVGVKQAEQFLEALRQEKEAAAGLTT